MPLTDLFSTELMDAEPGLLSPVEESRLWEIFEAIGRHWGGVDHDSSAQRSQWLEFLRVRTTEAPSYCTEYRHGLKVLEALKARDGVLVWTNLFAAAGPLVATTGLGHFRRYVVEEFIKVWLTSGGFRVFGAGNYNSFVSGSRFAIKPPYRSID